MSDLRAGKCSKSFQLLLHNSKGANVSQCAVTSDKSLTLSLSKLCFLWEKLDVSSCAPSEILAFNFSFSHDYLMFSHNQPFNFN